MKLTAYAYHFYEVDSIRLSFLWSWQHTSIISMKLTAYAYHFYDVDSIRLSFLWSWQHTPIISMMLTAYAYHFYEVDSIRLSFLWSWQHTPIISMMLTAYAYHFYDVDSIRLSFQHCHIQFWTYNFSIWFKSYLSLTPLFMTNRVVGCLKKMKNGVSVTMKVLFYLVCYA
jgi:hypothetical protein